MSHGAAWRAAGHAVAPLGRGADRRAGRPTAPAASRRAGGAGRTRGRRQHPLLRIRGPLGLRWRVGARRRSASLAILGAWVRGRRRSSTTPSSFLVPTPAATWDALVRDVARRHAVGTTCGVAAADRHRLRDLGGHRRRGRRRHRQRSSSVEAFFEPQIGFLRYIPASALTPLLLLWLGIGESPKITLIVVGTVFFNILMVADVARLVPRELLNAVGDARRRPVDDAAQGDRARTRVPGIIDVARINLAAAWLMLVVAELLAAQEGLAFRIVRAQRFRAVDTMFALLIVFGVIGLVSDLLLRWLRCVVARWARP